MKRRAGALAAGALLVSATALAYVDSKAPPLTAPLLERLLTGVPSLDALPAKLPEALRMNFVLKHGLNRVGERGHVVERRVSQSADPDAPRAILWDERSGLVLSYNGGKAGQTNPQRLDVHWLDDDNRFWLSSAQFPLAQPKLTEGTDCVVCHGPNRRPIFAMYPDWPAFYGSDNDELTSPTVATQRLELGDYAKFRSDVAPQHPRYAPLFDDAAIKRRLGVAGYPTWPYRNTLETKIDAESRAFAFRPGLRLGVLLNRLMAQWTIAKVKAHPDYAAVAPFFLFTLLDCPADKAPFASLAIAKRIAKPTFREGGLLDYRQLWQLFGLAVEDFDIRYGHGNKAYESNDATKNVMATGYIGAYWNAYFDGSATIDELVAYGVYLDLAGRDEALQGIIAANGLVEKYGNYKKRMRLDLAFFGAMDQRGLWIPIPYPAQIARVHHRERFQKEHAAQHDKLCSALAQSLTTSR